MCDSLAALKLANVTMRPPKSSNRVHSRFLEQIRPLRSGHLQSSPPFCRVQVWKPTSDSHIEFEVWLPLEKLKRRFQAVGNGGWGGSINYVGRDSAVDRTLRPQSRGYATASTDTGHREAVLHSCGPS
jgi:feruloyl esterase